MYDLPNHVHGHINITRMSPRSTSKFKIAHTSWEALKKRIDLKPRVRRCACNISIVKRMNTSRLVAETRESS